MSVSLSDLAAERARRREVASSSAGVTTSASSLHGIPAEGGISPQEKIARASEEAIAGASTSGALDKTDEGIKTPAPSPRQSSHTPELARDEFECPLCMKLLVSPLALICGHTFCKPCIRRSLAFQPQCPLCRSQCFLSAADVAPNYLLTKVIASRFPEESIARHAEAIADEVEIEALRLGLFFLRGSDAIFPHAPLSLLVYEPRYLLLMQRCMDNGVLFGVQESASSRFGVGVKIEAVQQMPRGRLLISGSALKRYQVDSEPLEESGTWGLHYSSVSFIQDGPLSTAVDSGLSVDLDAPPFDSGLSQRTRALLRGYGSDAKAATRLRDCMASIIIRVASGLTPSQFRLIAARYGPPPAPSDVGCTPERWSHYLADILALSHAERAHAFSCTSTLERLLLCYAFLERCERGVAAASQAHGPAAAVEGEPPQALPDGELDPCSRVTAQATLEPFVRGELSGMHGRLSSLLGHPLVQSLLLLLVVCAGIVWASRERAAEQLRGL